MVTTTSTSSTSPTSLTPKEKEAVEQYIRRSLLDHSRPNALRLKAGIRILMTTEYNTFEKICSKQVQDEIQDLIQLLQQPESLAPEAGKSEASKQALINYVKTYTLNNLNLLDERLAILPKNTMVSSSLVGEERLRSVVHTTAIRNIVTAATYIDQIEKKFKEAGFIGEELEEKVKIAANAMVRLHDAVVSGDVFAVMKELQVPGINVNLPNGDGLSFLHIASREDYIKIVQLLLEVPDINVNFRNNNGWTALHIASRLGHIEIARLLLHAPNIQVNAVNSDGWTPLHWAALDGQDIVAAELLKAPAIQVNPVEKSKTTPLHWAARFGHPTVIGLLLAMPEIAINPQDIEGKTPLYYAVQFDHLEATKALLKAKKIDVNIPDMDGLTPLHWAARNGRIDFVKCLLEVPGILTDLLDHNQMTPADWAKHNQYDELVPILNQKWQKKTRFQRILEKITTFFS